jgi:hypothetical protein
MTPSRIYRKGNFLWQEDTPSGSGMNLWSGSLFPNNNYPAEPALRAAILFEAASDLLEVLRELHDRLTLCADLYTAADAYDAFYREMVEEAIAKATGEPQ